jgi:hypothetical protein
MSHCTRHSHALRCTAALAMILAVAMTFVATEAPSVFAIGTGFTYQGQLKKSGAPYTGNADLTFSLYSASTGGLPLNTVALTAQTGSGRTLHSAARFWISLRRDRSLA